MPLYQVTSEALMELSPTSFKIENLQERRDIQRLLKDNISAIDNNVMVIAEEFGDWSEGGRRIDLLAIDRNANLVIIELKRTDDGGHMELQAIRYAAMVANMTWDQAKHAFQKYLTNNNIEGDAEAKLCQFLGWSEPIEDEFAQNVRIVLASANFSKEITTSVLWLNDRDVDITCVRLSLYKLDDRLVLSADQIIPLPEAESYQIEVRQKRREERISRNDSRDRSRFAVLYAEQAFEDDFPKADIGYQTVKLLEAHELINNEILEFLREDMSCGHKLLKTLDEITDVERRNSKYRFNNAPELVFNDIGYYAARNWSLTYIGRFMEKMKARFPQLSYTSTAD